LRDLTVNKGTTMKMPRASAGKTAAKKTAANKTVATQGKRQDRGAVDDRYFAEQTPEKRALLEELRALVVKGVPDATVSIKWGVPFYQRNGKNVCALAAFKENVAINFFAPPAVLIDPRKRLEGSGKGNRMLKVRNAGDLDAASILRWLKAVVAAQG
jgi:hypothetical protein